MLLRTILAGTLLMVLAAAAPLAMAQDGDDPNYCQTINDANAPRHPQGSRIAERFGVSYATVMAWFCQPHATADGEAVFGFGQIKQALAIAQVTGGSAGDYLARRAAGEGWGQIKKDLGLKGGFGKGGPPPWAGQPGGRFGTSEDDASGSGRPAWAGPPGQNKDKRGGP
jgi:hypothetical protein